MATAAAACIRGRGVGVVTAQRAPGARVRSRRHAGQGGRVSEEAVAAADAVAGMVAVAAAAAAGEAVAVAVAV
eukprot:CAMPEP_0174709846 /NCGR_PEP_ID=MMETSP1094-20130205/11670_1 /TAXON_ID=156173 /ORGANISM="Chrysochromulina brevifilum, Strain UTEX LB 985" /LENGTH=72 /DNA_ID=CAMNT_0015908565 /DNA_START=72 /DNA_END=287 /DNA_ORIENTATION=-